MLGIAALDDLKHLRELAPMATLRQLGGVGLERCLQRACPLDDSREVLLQRYLLERGNGRRRGGRLRRR